MIAVGDAGLFSTGGRLAGGEPIGGNMGLSPMDPESEAAMAELGIYPFSVRQNLWPARIATRNRHFEKFNLVFCDGHVENLNLKSGFDLRNPLVSKRWNRDNLPHPENMGWFAH
jgi:prepilin-type processing-associated H-X9-DG protein